MIPLYAVTDPIASASMPIGEGRGRNHIARVLADSSGAPLGCTPTMPLPGQTKAESDQERIMLALERIANILQVMNANLATVAKTMIDARPISGSANGVVSRSGQIRT